MTRALVAVSTVVAVGLSPPQAQVGPRPVGTAALGGTVIRGDTEARTPVARAVVSLDAGDGRGRRQTVTDTGGGFVFDRLPAGRFLLTVTKSGWVPTYYGSPRPGRPPGVRITVGDGDSERVDIPLTPGSVIGGRIVDDEGRPLARLFPRLMESRLVGRQRMLARTSFPYSVGSFERATNDLGEFRLFGLPPGTYYLVVVPSITSGARLTSAAEVRWAFQPPGAAPGQPPDQGPTAGYAPVYFPGTTNPADAQPIVVGPGEVQDGLVYRVGYVTVARVSGTLHRMDGAATSGTRVVLDARARQVNLEGGYHTATADANGQFVFQNIPPGDYRITARTASSPQGATDLWGQTDVVVTGQDVEGVGLTLAPASMITGRVTFAGTSIPPPEDLSRIRLQFTSGTQLASNLAANVGAGPSVQGVHTATVASDGTFRVIGLEPEGYIASAAWSGMQAADGRSGWWLTSVLVAGRDLGDTPLDVPPNAQVDDVILVFRDRTGTIEGTLSDAAGRPAPEYFVLAFPVERDSWTTTSRRARPAVRPDTDGHYRITGLLPGSYYLGVVTSVDAEETSDPGFLEAIVPQAIRVTIGDGATLRQDLRVAGALPFRRLVQR